MEFGLGLGLGTSFSQERAFCTTKQVDTQGTAKGTCFVFNSSHGHLLTTDFAVLIQTLSSLVLILSCFTKGLMRSESDAQQPLLSVLPLQIEIFLLTSCEKITSFPFSFSVPSYCCCLLLS